ncbi:B-cell receptor CD22-like isoform X2 [Salminus brasiliensis]|uniref:B-cell receptor CD22-like isoform X2 n=1 Tax=Salminus brasiliensis TaxID=930266 RepID=UPI003B833005
MSPQRSANITAAVILISLAGLKIKVSDTQRGGKKLTCSSTCTLPNSTYIWYRNGQPVSECRSASCSVVVVSGEVSYSCAVEGHHLSSPPVYPPKDTRAVVLPSAERVEGDSVTLTCSSDADPPVLTFYWFKQRAAADKALGTGQNYSITNISSQHSGLYYCTALNQLGQHSSTPTRLDVFSDWWKQYTVWAAVGAVPALALSLLTAVLCVQRKRRAERGADVQTPKPEDDMYTALDPTTTSSSDYNTLTHVTHSPNNTYSALNPAARTSSDYDTLTGVGLHLVMSGALDEENN